MPKPERSDRAVPYQVRVLDRAIDILDALTARRTDLSIREIVEATGLNRSTTIRLCANLEKRSGATIVLAVRDGDYSVTVDKRQGMGADSAMVPMPGEVGAVRPLTYGPVGQVFLATLPTDEVEELLDKHPLEQHTPYSVLNRRRFLARLPRVRDEGYAIEVNEVVEGLMGIAAPIFDFSGGAAGALSLGFPATRENDRAFLDEAISDLVQGVAEASANMGYAGHADAAEDETDAAEAAEKPGESAEQTTKG